jgi:hypothetical protein
VADYITSSEFKTRFAISVSSDDTRIGVHVTAASREVDSICGRHFGTATSTTRYFKPVGPGLVLVDDCYTVTAVKMDTGDDGAYATTLTAGTDYIVEPYNGVGINGQTGWPVTQLKATGYSYYFHTHTRRPSISVTANFGWAAVPSDVVEATFLLAHRLYFERDVPSGNVPGSAEFGGAPLRRPWTVERLLQPYIRADRKLGIAG